MNHTPGPWIYEIHRKDDGTLACVTTVAHCCDYVIGLRSHVPGGNYRDGDPEGDPEADAQLITAAPDLLAAAKEAFQYIPFHGADCEGVTEYEEGAIFDATKGCTCFLSRLRAAIIKAEPAPPTGKTDR